MFRNTWTAGKLQNLLARGTSASQYSTTLIGERQYGNLFAQRHRSGSICEPGHWCLWVPASGNTWWNGNSNEPQRTLDLVALRMVDMFERHTSRYFQRRSHHRLDFWGKEEELTISKVHLKTIRFWSRPYWQVDKHAQSWANSELGQSKVNGCTLSFHWQTENGVL